MNSERRDYKGVYLHLLRDHHARLVATSSLAAPHYAVAIESLAAWPTQVTRIEDLQSCGSFSAGIRKKMSAMVENAGGEEAVQRSLGKASRSRQAREGLLSTINELPTVANTTTAGMSTSAVGASRASNSIRSSDASRSTEKTRANRTNRDVGNPSTARDTPPATKKDAVAKQPRAGPKLYRPPYRTGGYGILIALWLLLQKERSSAEPGVSNDSTEGPHFSKEGIISVAKKYCTSSYTHSIARRTAGSSGPSKTPRFATAWATMKTLLNKGLVWQKGRPATWTLSPDGLSVANVLAQEAGLTPPAADCASEHNGMSTTASGTGQAQAATRNSIGATPRVHVDSSDGECDADIFSSSPSSVETEHKGSRASQRNGTRAQSSLILPPKEPCDDSDPSDMDLTTVPAQRKSGPRTMLVLPPKQCDRHDDGNGANSQATQLQKPTGSNRGQSRTLLRLPTKSIEVDLVADSVAGSTDTTRRRPKPTSRPLYLPEKEPAQDPTERLRCTRSRARTSVILIDDSD